MNLMIVESPNKVKKIKAILGPGWDVAASLGHIRDLPVRELGLAAPDYKQEYVFTDRGEGTVNGLRPRAARAEMVYLATDPDREGEGIAWHLKETLSLRKYQRVTFDAITESVIKKAIATPRQLDMKLSMPRPRGAELTGSWPHRVPWRYLHMWRFHPPWNSCSFPWTVQTQGRSSFSVWTAQHHWSVNRARSSPAAARWMRR